MAEAAYAFICDLANRGCGMSVVDIVMLLSSSDLEAGSSAIRQLPRVSVLVTIPQEANIRSVKEYCIR